MIPAPTMELRKLLTAKGVLDLPSVVGPWEIPGRGSRDGLDLVKDESSMSDVSTAAIV